MDALAAEEIFLFEGFRLDRRAGGLFRADGSGSQIPVAIGSRALDLLVLLVRRHGDLVSKEEIMTAVWPGLTVAGSNLPTQIWALRRVLDRGRAQGSCIQTVAGRGYRFIAEVTHPSVEVLPASPWVSSAVATREPIVAPPLSLVVLPFDNFSDCLDQHHFADRITDDLTTDLSRFNNMRVVSRTTAFTYRDRPVDAKQIGRELGVRYVLEGSAQRFSDRIRLNAHLIDAQADTHLWAQRFDRVTDDPVAPQDEITKRITVALYQALIDVEAARPSQHPDVLDYVLRGRVANLRAVGRDCYAESIGLFERAVALDRHSPEAQAWLAETLALRAFEGIAQAAAADIARAGGLAAQALAASPRSAFAHVAQGKILCAQGRFAEAIPEYEAANAINPGLPHHYGYLGACKLWTDSITDAIVLAERAMAISPRDPYRAYWYFSIGQAHLLQSRTNEAILWHDKVHRLMPHFPLVHGWLAAARALNGEIERARADLAAARGLSRDGRYSSISRLRAAEHFGAPKIHALVENTYLAGLRKAGMPEE